MPYGEADTRAKYLDPAMHNRGWTEDLIRREVTAGEVVITASGRPRRRMGRADYTLRIKVLPGSQPVAVALIEAKKESLPPGHGLDQAKGYTECKRLNVPFVFSSNGHMFVEFDRSTGQTSAPRPMGEFPSPDELRHRYEAIVGFDLESAAARPLLQPYAGGESGRRYYQDAAIRAVLEKVAQSETRKEPARALLSLATGAGKTFIAVNLLKRIADAGQLRRALFVCDRDELREQALGHFQNVFGSDAVEVYRRPDGSNNAKNARVHIATYQTLDVDDPEGAASFLVANYPKGYFSHIVIDECHRSAWGKWSEVITRNPDAVQVGLTATPRQLDCPATTEEAEEDARITADNVKYFGEPVYEYDLAQAIEDGYLAAIEIQKGRVNLDDTGITLDEILARNPTDAITGRPITRDQLQQRYEKTEYEDRILLPDRVQAMCADLFNYLVESGGPEQKTIIFCARDHHADDVAVALNNLYNAWCVRNGKEPLDFYAFKCTGESGGEKIPEFRATTRSHFIATTVDLLSTGVDLPSVRNVVFFRYIKSPISLYQMVGRGTRIDLVTDKLAFRVYDYTDATRLFGQSFFTKPRRPSAPGDPAVDDHDAPPEPVVSVEGFDVHVNDAGRFVIAQVDGQAMPVPLEEYKARLAARLVAEAPTLEEFRARWLAPDERRELLGALTASGYSPSLVRLVDRKSDYDLYDVLAEMGWGTRARTRHDRAQAFVYKHEAWLDALPAGTAATLKAIARQFDAGGTEGLENPNLFQTPEVKAAGGLSALRGAGRPADLFLEVKTRMFSV